MNETAIPLIVELGRPLAKAAVESGRRFIYFEATREGVVDREGEEVAADALWKSRELFLSQGNLDIGHFAWLANPLTGRPDADYVIGLPVNVKRDGPSIYVKGEVFSPGGEVAPEEGNADRANKFWHAVAVQSPAMRYFPSVYGKIRPGGVQLKKVGGQLVRRIVDVEWLSVGFWTRAQHPALGAVSPEPMGPLAKADAGRVQARDAFNAAVRLDWGTFAKSVSAVGVPVTDHAALTGVQALTRESLEGGVRRGGDVTPDISAKAARVVVLRALKAGKVRRELRALTAAFASQGMDGDAAKAAASSLLRDLEERES